MDFDGLFLVERRGEFLVFELKHPGQELDTGQRIALEQLSRKPGFTVWLMRGTGSHPTELQEVRNGEWKGAFLVDREAVQLLVNVWYRRANMGAA